MMKHRRNFVVAIYLFACILNLCRFSETQTQEDDTEPSLPPPPPPLFPMPPPPPLLSTLFPRPTPPRALSTPSDQIDLEFERSIDRFQMLIQSVDKVFGYKKNYR